MTLSNICGGSFAEIVNTLKPLSVFAKSSIVDIQQDPGHVPVTPGDKCLTSFIDVLNSV